jgi:hypothetical protein
VYVCAYDLIETDNTQHTLVNVHELGTCTCVDVCTSYILSVSTCDFIGAYQGTDWVSSVPMKALIE